MRQVPIALLVLAALGCGSKPEAPLPEVTAFHRAALPEGPDDPAWRAVAAHVAPLLLQDLVEPRQLAATTAEVTVQAVHDGSRLAFRLTWSDPTADDLPGAARFSDACAVQLPATPAADLPAPQMGEAGRPVEITSWRASWQASVDGRPDDITALYPRAHPDHYPFTAAPLTPGSPEQQEMARRYAPARALGNVMEGPRTSPVEDLIADGPGTLRPAPRTVSSGGGRRTAHGWAVQLVRPLPNGTGPGGRGAVAFAVWDGAHLEAGARKMRTGWVPLALRERS